MIQITLTEVQITIVPMPGGTPGSKLMQFMDPKSGIGVFVPMPAEICPLIAAQLRTDIVVASGPLPSGPDGAQRIRQ